MAEKFRLGGDLVEVALVRRHPRPALSVGATLVDAALVSDHGSGRFEAEIGGRRVAGWRHVDGLDVFVRLDGRTHHLRREIPGIGGSDTGSAADILRASMPGVVVSVDCTAGQAVARGQTLVVIESMKMQTAIASPRDGVIEQVHFARDASFDKGAVLVSLRTGSE